MHQGYVKVLAANEIKPEINPGFTEDLRVIASNTGMKVSMPETRWTRIRQAGENLVAKPESFNNNLMPDVTGMGLRDAIFLLENMGISVKPTGKGKVKKQSIPAGTRVGRNSHVIIELV
jgi:cell division protein FtsI (penicillin-binding protein 3)